MKPRISICITTYNVAPFLPDCLNGALKQKINVPFEIVIVDDLSSDGTQAIIHDYEEKYPAIIRAYYNTENLKYAKNFLKALSLCTGEYIAILDGDDYWTDESKLQKQLNFLELNPGYTISHHNGMVDDGHGHQHLFNKEPKPETQTIDTLLTTVRNWNSSFLYRNIFKSNFPSWLAQCIHPDYPLHVLHAVRGNIYYLDTPMGVYRMHENNISKIWQHQRAAEFSENAIFIMMKLKREVPGRYHSFLNLIASRHRDLVAGYYLKKKMYGRFFSLLLQSYYYKPWRSIKEYKDSYYHLFRQASP